MPDRFGKDVRALDGTLGTDGLRDYLITYKDTWSEIDNSDPAAGSPNINPPSWRVNFDASASTGEIVGYRWEVNGKQIEIGSNPKVSHNFPSEGKYTVTLTVADLLGRTSEVTQEVTVQDWLIVALGDSYASGEGNPELGGSAWIEEVVSAYSDLERANDDLNQAVRDLADANFDFQVTSDDIQPALNALNRWNNVCPSISLECAGATADLTTALIALGFSEVADLLTKGFQFILNKIQDILNVAQKAVDLAQKAFDTAQTVVDGAQGEIDTIFEQGAAWQTRTDISNDGPSHRSSLSGQALAALALERADPHTSVTFVHLAYSGAAIRLGNRSNLVTDDGKSQLDFAKKLVGDREIDALLVSIGGNDAGFGSIIFSLLLTDNQICDRLRTLVESQCRQILNSAGVPPALSNLACVAAVDRLESLCVDALGHVSILPKQEHEQILADGLARLPKAFGALADRLGRADMFPGLPSNRLYFTEYPNMTEGDDGRTCPDFLTVTAADWRWVRDTMTVGLNTTVRREVTKHGWNFIDGIFDGFHRHGYCASDHWVNHPEESVLIQGDIQGTAHPTAEGHQVYGEQISNRLLADLYISGDLSRPRAPGYGPVFRRGDSDRDGAIGIADALRILNVLFLGAAPVPCEKAADANDDGHVDISDPLRILGFLFLGDPAPPAPFASCGFDPTLDLLACRGDSTCK